MEKMFAMPFGMNHASTGPYSPFWVVFILPVLQFTCIPFFRLDVIDTLGSFEGCNGRAVVKVRPIARELLYLQHGHLDSHDGTFLFCIFVPLVGSSIVDNDVHLEL